MANHQKRTVRETFWICVRVFCLVLRLGPAILWWRIFRSDHKLRKAITNAGPVCVKAAQWAIDRVGLLPEDVCCALRPLRDQTERHPWEHTKHVIQTQFPKGTFLHVQREAFACGSVGQVHRVALSDKANCETPAVLKVLHPNVREDLQRDLDVLLFLLRFIPGCAQFDIDHVRDHFLAQGDLRAEAANLQTFRKAFAGHPAVQFPEPLLEATDDALVMTLVPGVPFDRLVEKDPHLAKHAINLRVATYMKMAFIDNCTHGDMHPGNLLFHINETTQTLQLGVVDAGIASDIRNAAALRRFVEGMFALQPEDLADVFEEMNENKGADVARFRTMVLDVKKQLTYEPGALGRYNEIFKTVPFAAEVVAKWREKIVVDEENACVICPTASNMAILVRTVLEAMRTCHLVIPSDIILVVMSIVVVEGQSSHFLSKDDHLFNDALIFAGQSGLVDMEEWLGYDPVPLLALDRARRSTESVTQFCSAAMRPPEESDDEDE
jgi:predicted unusual protein kinase regulating ubiquinone biosynthesis (AarF/ABC1/UbiB family)